MPDGTSDSKAMAGAMTVAMAPSHPIPSHIPVTAVTGRAAPRKYSSEQAEVVASVARTLAAIGAPPLDRGGKSILAQQVKNLLVGGWPAAEIEASALTLARRYDRYHGHKALTQLQRLMEQSDEKRQESEHKSQDFDGMALDVARNLAAQGIRNPAIDRVLGRAEAAAKTVQHPSHHAFSPDDADKSSCSVCSGPIGVHVRRSVV